MCFKPNAILLSFNWISCFSSIRIDFTLISYGRTIKSCIKLIYYLPVKMFIEFVPVLLRISRAETVYGVDGQGRQRTATDGNDDNKTRTINKETGRKVKLLFIGGFVHAPINKSNGVSLNEVVMIWLECTIIWPTKIYSPELSCGVNGRSNTFCIVRIHSSRSCSVAHDKLYTRSGVNNVKLYP